jgi:basic membrane protein A and related proteins
VAAVGLGIAEAVEEHGQAYAIGVDSDWAVRYPEYADIVLTSIEKGFDVTPVEAVRAIVGGTFTGGTHIGTLENGEVGLAPFHSLDRLVSAKVRADLEQIKAGIVAGEIKTKP